MNFHHTFFDQKLPSGKSAAAGRQGPSRTGVYAVVLDRAAAEVFVPRCGIGLCFLQRLIWGGRDRRRPNQLRTSGDGNVREGGSRGKRPAAREVRGREGDMASYRGCWIGVLVNFFLFLQIQSDLPSRLELLLEVCHCFNLSIDAEFCNLMDMLLLL
jgi:hypothetical protein